MKPQTKKFLLATVSAVAFSATARAADMPRAMPAKGPTYSPTPIATWDGFYVGVQGGVVRREALFGAASDTVVAFRDSGSKTGGAIGGLVGYNWQHGNFVYGLEGDWSWIGARTHSERVNSVSRLYEMDWVATARARAGLAVDATLFYLTGGAAFGHLNNNFAFGFLENPFFSFSENKTRVGWTAGAGVEHEFAPRWIARAEARYVDFGKSDVSCMPGTTPCAGSYRSGFSNALWMGLIGLNYRFGDGRAADWSHAQAYATASGFEWAGGYLGVQGGVAQNYGSFEDSDCFLFSCQQVDHRKAGGTVGGFAGYNWQRGSLVYGLEGDWNWIRSKANRVDPHFDDDGDSLATSFDAHWLATVRGRVGLAIDRSLLYVTGGAAFGHVTNGVTLTGTGNRVVGAASYAENRTRAGWTAGAGAEYMLSPHWTERAEFRYVDLGKSSASCASASDLFGCTSEGFRGEFSNALKLGVVGLAYKF